MDNEFLQIFSDYTSVELLKITGQADHYQPAAVEAATTILSQRQVSDAETKQANVELSELEAQRKADAEKWTQIMDLFQPVIKPTESRVFTNYIIIFCSGLFLKYLWSAYYSVKFLYWFFFKSKEVRFGTTELLEIYSLLFWPLLIYLLWRRERWGWILGLASSIYVIISWLWSLDPVTLYHSLLSRYYIIYFLTLVFTIVLNPAFIYFLCKPDTKELFNIDRSTQRKTIAYTFLASVLFLAAKHIIQDGL